MKLRRSGDQEVGELGTLDGTDQISQLPAPLVHHICSFLLVKDAANTSMLSKSFYDAWTTLPYLNFGEDCFPKFGRYAERETDMKKMHKLLEIVDVMIIMRLKQKLSIHKFLIQLTGYLIDLSPYINRIMGSITEANIKELVFEVRNRLQKRYTLPEAVYTAKTIDKLRLQGFKLDSPSGGVKLSSLRELYLSKSYLDNNVIQLLISSSPSLEVLDLEGCHGFDSLQIFGSLKLRRIKLNDHARFDDLKKVEIQAPSLEWLSSFSCGRLLDVNLSACKSLKHLQLHKPTVSVNWANDLLTDLPLLEEFSLIDCRGLESIRTSSNRLKKLFLWNCVDLVSLELDTPNLSTFKYLGDVSIYLSLKALAIKHLTVGPPEHTPWCQNELLGFLRKFNHFTVLSLSFWDLEKVIVVKETRENLCSPLYGVKSLSLYHYRRGNKSIFLDLLDSILWIAPCLDTLSFVNDFFKITLQFIHEKKLNDGVEGDCCSSLPFNCWRHTLKQVKCVNGQQHVDEKELKNYFVENANILESVDFVSFE